MASSKSKNFDWNIESTKTLIALYEENECLYNNLAPDYKNRDKRLSIMANIAKLISDGTGRVCLVADVRKKINSLRSQYLAEKLKITKCKSGSGGDYNPTVYWFPLLRFLDISSEADASQSNLDSESPQVDSDSMDTQQSQENETVPPRKSKKRNSASAQDEDADSLIKEATATMRHMSQQITSNTNTNSQNHITAFCNFVNSELTNILQASNNNFVNKAKRKIQMCLFDIWDEIDIGNLHEERPSTRTTNFSEDSIISQNIPSETITTSKSVPSKSKAVPSVVKGTAKSIIVKRKDLMTEKKMKQIKRENLKPQFKDFKLYCTQEDGNFEINTEDDSSVDLYHINNPQGDGTSKLHIEEENNINLLNTEPTEASSEKILYFINNYDPEEL